MIVKGDCLEEETRRKGEEKERRVEWSNYKTS
jgi:hypothetical protein